MRRIAAFVCVVAFATTAKAIDPEAMHRQIQAGISQAAAREAAEQAAKEKEAYDRMSPEERAAYDHDKKVQVEAMRIVNQQSAKTDEATPGVKIKVAKRNLAATQKKAAKEKDAFQKDVWNRVASIYESRLAAKSSNPAK